MTDKPEVICIQEPWLKPHLEFIIKGYYGIRLDKCNDPVKDAWHSLYSRCIVVGNRHECIVIEIFKGPKESILVYLLVLIITMKKNPWKKNDFSKILLRRTL